ncbi:MAG: hypothetical protein U0176_22325 [Bacteroidia bacterium]
MILNPQTDTALRYFQAPAGHFWRWSKSGEVIEFDNGLTLCFRDELQAYLNLLTSNGFPKLSSMLMVLAACKDDYQTCSLYRSGIQAIADRMKEKLPADADKAMLFLDRIHAMPREYRGADRRGFLMKLIFPGPFWEDMPFKTEASAREVWFCLKRGELDNHLSHAPTEVSLRELEQDLSPLINAYYRIPTVEALVHLLRTGLPDTPKPAKAEMPPPPDELPEEASLLEELLEDKRTCGVAHLAQQLIAALNIPMQSRGSNDMPIGGVSDITNKGSLDRLLLSELAQDDHALMARLANNEALYLRREEPPLKIERERIVIIDSTLRMWGYPKAFAVAAAIACQANHVAEMPLRSFSLGGVQAHPADIASKAGILNLLEQLDAHLDCGNALEECLATVGRQGKEIIFVTGEETVAQPEFAKQLSALQPKMDVLILLGRHGEMQLFQLRQGHRRLHSKAQFDLDDLLFRGPQKRRTPGPGPNPKPERPNPEKPGSPEDGIWPAFITEHPHPLRFPSNSIRLRRINTRIFGKNRVAVLTEKRQVLYWDGVEQGAVLAVPHFPSFSYEYIELVEDEALIVVGLSPNEKKLTVYRYEFETAALMQFDFSEAIGQYWCALSLMGSRLLARKQEYANGKYTLTNYVLQTDSGRVTQEDPEGKPFPSPLVEVRQRTETIANIRQVVNPGYSCFLNNRRVGFTTNGALVIENRRLVAKGSELGFDYGGGDVELWKEAEYTGVAFEGGGNARMRRVTWKDGTTAFLDDRGFIHLRSSDPSLPEVSILMVIGSPTAAWTSDGKWFGNPYFHERQNEGEPDALDLFKDYIFPIYSRIPRP